jgi:WhiB family redox-sensing transcriptional regulator
MQTTPLPTDLLTLNLDERPWAAYAACRREDPDLFFPMNDEAAEAAMKICSACAVQGECLDWALDTRIKYGIWGGATERDRRRLLRRTA